MDSSGDKSSESAIPGLNYKTKQTKPPQLGPMEFVTPFSKTPLLPTPQRHQAPPSSLPAAPIMNRPMSGPPPRFPEPYYMMPPPPPGMGPMAPGMPFPHLAAMRNRFPVQGELKGFSQVLYLKLLFFFLNCSFLLYLICKTHFRTT